MKTNVTKTLKVSANHPSAKETKSDAAVRKHASAGNTSVREAAKSAAEAVAIKITVLDKTNPHKAGSKRAKAFSQMLTCKTTADYAGKPKYLKSWAAKKLIKLGA